MKHLDLLSIFIKNKPSAGTERSSDRGFFFGGNDNTPSFMVPRTEQVFLKVPVYSTLVRKDGVTPILCCDYN
jgi:hypothetical protein